MQFRGDRRPTGALSEGRFILPAMRARIPLLVAAALLLAGSADARPRRHLNMPRGWTWPPSAEMKDAGLRCKARLDELGVAWKKAPRTRKVATPIYVPSMELRGLKLEAIWRKGPFVMDCHLAMALAEVGPELTALGIQTLRFTTIHDYRTIRKNHRHYNILSRHAIGLAMDVYEMVTTDGTKLVVERRYRHSKLLHQVEKAVIKSGHFRALLTPGNNPRSHPDHFHFEAAMPLGEKPGQS